MRPAISAATVVAGVAGAPVRHSLSPLIHNAWLAAAEIDGVYVAFSPPATGFESFASGLRGGAVRGLNVTAPFKHTALEVADRASERARRAGSANLLIFEPDGIVAADNTDGEGLLDAFAGQAPEFDFTAGPLVIFGAGGAARGAAMALLEAGAPMIHIVNRTLARAEALCDSIGDKARAFPQDRAREAMTGANGVINATVLAEGDGEGPGSSLDALAATAVVMDMTYSPVRTRLLDRAAAKGLTTVDGLAMLIGQAVPSFQALYGSAPPAIDVRSVALAALDAGKLGALS
jgi:shikimate dehydrogenase